MATAPIRPLAGKLPYAMGADLKKRQNKKQTNKKDLDSRDKKPTLTIKGIRSRKLLISFIFRVGFLSLLSKASEFFFQLTALIQYFIIVYI